MQQKNLLIPLVPVYSMYKCKYNQTGLKKLCMYVYSCKSGQMYKINFYLSCDYLLHEKCMGNPVHLCIWQKKCLTKSDQMFIPTRQYSISGHDFCGLNFERECAFNPRVLI